MFDHASYDRILCWVCLKVRTRRRQKTMCHVWRLLQKVVSKRITIQESTKVLQPKTLCSVWSVNPHTNKEPWQYMDLAEFLIYLIFFLSKHISWKWDVGSQWGNLYKWRLNLKKIYRMPSRKPQIFEEYSDDLHGKVELMSTLSDSLQI